MDRAAQVARENAEIRGHVVDPNLREKYETSPQTALSDALSDTEAPPNSLVTYRNGKKEYIPEDVLSGKVRSGLTFPHLNRGAFCQRMLGL
ncbi:unnamed protein product [Effrenium voratum]|nr:unnamed protein product [Effrenium voratum]